MIIRLELLPSRNRVCVASRAVSRPRRVVSHTDAGRGELATFELVCVRSHFAFGELSSQFKRGLLAAYLVVFFFLVTVPCRKFRGAGGFGLRVPKSRNSI